MWLDIQPGDLLTGKYVKMYFLVIGRQEGRLTQPDEIFNHGPYIELEIIRLTENGPCPGRFRIFQKDVVHLKTVYQLFRDGQEIEIP